MSSAKWHQFCLSLNVLTEYLFMCYPSKNKRWQVIVRPNDVFTGTYMHKYKDDILLVQRFSLQR